MNLEKETVIRGCTVLLEVYQDGDDSVSSCWITKGEYCSSLGVLQDFGTLEHEDSFATIELHPTAIKAIEAWAYENGY